MLFHMKDQKAAVLENDLNKLQKDGPAVWASLPEDELFTPAGFSEEQAEATAYSNYSYWGSTFRAFFKNKMAVALLIALVAVVAFAFVQPHLPGQVDPNLCEVDPATGIQYRNIAPGQQGFIWGSNAIGQDLWARIWAGARTSLTIAFFVAMIEAVVGITVGVLWGYVRQLDFFFTELYNICDNIPSTIILILISYVASPSIQTLILGMSLTGWIAMARFIRNQILIIRDRDYNVASRCIGTVPENCAYVGDNPVRDVEGAVDAGYGSMILYEDAGTADREGKLPTVKPDYRIKAIRELLDLFPDRKAL